jgi:integrase
MHTEPSSGGGLLLLRRKAPLKRRSVAYFCSGAHNSIGTIVKRALLRAGYSPEPFAGHSLRSGHVTQGAMNGVREIVIMKQTGHRSLATLRKYIRHGEIFKQNSAASLGL